MLLTKKTKKERNKSPENNTRPPTGCGVKMAHNTKSVEIGTRVVDFWVVTFHSDEWSEQGHRLKPGARPLYLQVLYKVYASGCVSLCVQQPPYRNWVMTGATCSMTNGTQVKFVYYNTTRCECVWQGDVSVIDSDSFLLHYWICPSTA